MILACHVGQFASAALPLAFWTPGPGEMLVIGIIALLLYGGRLPEVAREWGKTFNEFRRSLNSVRDDFNDALYSEPDPAPRLEYHPTFRDDAEVDPVDPADAVAADAEIRDSAAEETAEPRPAAAGD